MNDADKGPALSSGALQIAAAPLQMLAVVPTETDRGAARLRNVERAEAVGYLAGGLVHDFSNLLGVIVGNLDRVGRLVPADATAKRCVSDAITATDRAIALVRRLLAFVRQEPLLPQVVDIDRLVLDLGPLLEVAAPGCRVVLDPGCAWSCLVDANQLENALLNLAVNARDAMPGGGRLTIATRALTAYPGDETGCAPGEYVVTEVRDSGFGMSPEVRAKALEPFFTTKGEGAGTGLGLSQVRRFATECGGALRLDSEVGKGTTVALYIPRAASAPATLPGRGG